MKSLAVVTSGTKGIGKAIVQLFIQKGFDVITCSRSVDNLQDLRDTCTPDLDGNELFTHACDMATSEGVQSFIDFTIGLNRTIDVLVNNTGIFIPGQISNEDPGVLEKTLQTNLYSAYHLTRGILPNMMSVNKGHIFNMCSIASITAYANGGSYAISKFALYGMSKVLREELKPYGIRVTAILPGATLTDSWAGVDLPQERFIKPEDVANIVWGAYELSDRAVLEEVIVRPQLGDL